MKKYLTDVLFAFLGTIAVLVFALQIYYSSTRSLTPLEMSLISFFGLMLSLAASCYFSRRYSGSQPIDTTIEYLIDLLEGARKIGLKSIDPSMNSRRKNATSALGEMTSGFDFLGIGGHKFIPRLFDTKNSIGKFIAKNNNDSIRILLLDPECNVINKWVSDLNKAALIRKDIIASLNILVEQIKRGRKVQVRLYAFAPPMRLQIVDQERAYMCEYSPFSDGWDAPQLYFHKNAARPFVNCISELFDYIWRNANDLDIEKYNPNAHCTILGH